MEGGGTVEVGGTVEGRGELWKGGGTVEVGGGGGGREGGRWR